MTSQITLQSEFEMNPRFVFENLARDAKANGVRTVDLYEPNQRFVGIITVVDQYWAVLTLRLLDEDYGLSIFLEGRI